MPPTDSETLYRVLIKTPASAMELADFCELLESEGYTVVTDLNKGELKIRPDNKESHADYEATTQ